MRALGPDDEETAALLARCGLKLAAARCLALLLRDRHAGRAEAAEACGVSPQDAGEAMRELEGSGLVASEAVAKGPGRPALRYRLAGDADAAVARLVAARREALAREAAALDALESRFSASRRSP